MSLEQLKDWTDKIEVVLHGNGNNKVTIPTVFTAAPSVLKKFEATPYAQRLKNTGVKLSIWYKPTAPLEAVAAPKSFK